MVDVCHNCSHSGLNHLYKASSFDAPNNEEGQQFGIARCSHCAVVNTTGINAANVGATYTGEYYGSSSQKFLRIIEKTVALVNARRARSLTKAWRGAMALDVLPDVLDIGCGRGQLLQAFQDEGANVLGLERDEFPSSDGSESFVRVGTLFDAQYSDHKFDIVILWHVFEHLDSLELLLDSVTDHLKDNGQLVIAVPNFSSLQQRLFSRYWFHLDLPRHLVHIEANWLLQNIEKRGYTIEKVSYMDLLQNVYGFIQSALNVLAPQRLNRYYRLLKHGRSADDSNVLPILGWSVLALLLLPFAVLDSVAGSLLGRGATVEVVARRGMPT
ncbi:MAG: 2-polyprenyl-3-methyl-5-hydroxy-6-metoxy-1,4-benzoquinol methylase [Halioglobus sp.]|jgi:2-polyprenyl-3-methyl-5-hydroxy-6-metoxy-1,4-benzoquinol methylase